MRIALMVLILAGLSFSLNLTVIRFMNVSTSTSCPGDWLYMNATDSEGSPVPDVELRLVLYEPYQGLRALEHTGPDGLASVQLTKPGHYRLYIYTNDSYDHDQYVEFDYPSMCPPPPPVGMNVSVATDCQEKLLIINVTSGGAPLSGVFISAQDWSSMTGDSGSVSFPLEEGDVFINASKQGYSNQPFYYTASCAPPPECTDDSGCFGFQACLQGDCINLTGTCGYPADHAWVFYACCSDLDCGNASICRNHTCVLRPSPPANASIPNATNTTNLTPPSNATGTKPTGGAGGCLGSVLLLMVLAIARRF